MSDEDDARDRNFRRRFGGGGRGFRSESDGGAPDGATRLAAAADLLGGLAAREVDDTAGDDEVAALRDLADTFARTATIPATLRDTVRMEALIVADDSRPSSFIRDGRLPAPDLLGPLGTAYQFDPFPFEAAIAATGRILSRHRLVGTGTLVALDGTDGIVEGVLTAAHVAVEVGATEIIDFGGEVGTPSRCLHRLGSIIACGGECIGSAIADDAWDFAVIALGEAIDGAPRPAALRPTLAPRRLEDGEPIGVVGYPARPPVPPSALLAGTIWHRLLGGLFNVKRFAPGRLLARAAAPEAYRALDARMLLHDATTIGGASGGALLTVGGDYAALHVGGRNGEANLALKLSSVAARQGWHV